MLLPNYSIGSHFRSIEAALSFEFSYAFEPVFISRPNQYLPVIFSSEEGKINPSIWGIRSNKSETMLLLWVRMEGIIKNMHTRVLIRNNRCLVPANGFFIRSGTSTYFIYYPGEKVVTFGAVWQMHKDRETGKMSTTFSMISCPAQERIAHLTSRMPLLILPSSRRKFLKKEIPLMDITRILKKDNKLEVNGFPIDPELFCKKNVTKNDFIASGDKLYKKKVFPEKAILGSYYYYYQS